MRIKLKLNYIETSTTYFFCILLGAVFAFPFLWQMTTSFKPASEIFILPYKWFPSRIEWSNYTEAWASADFNRYFINTVIVAVMNVIGHVFVGAFVAYGFSKVRFPGRDILFVLVLSTMMVPFHVKTVPLYLVYHKIGWLNSLKPLFVPALFAGDAMNLFLFKQYFRSLPDELDEAAEIDGCSPIRIFFHIAFPLSMPVVATVAIFSFMNSWNNLWEALIFITKNHHYTLSLGLRHFMSEFGSDYHLLMAASTLTILPCILVFFMLQKYFVSGIATTGLKG